MEAIFDFLQQLKSNNNRQWFNENKQVYLRARAEFEDLVDQLIRRTAEFEPALANLTPADSIFRIYRDTRFSKDKRPYKEYFCAFLAPGGRKSHFAGYYVHLEPNNSFVGGGIYCPKSDVLRAVREYIYENTQDFLQIIESPEFKETFGEIYGQKLKSVPRGFPRDFKYIELLRYKSYALTAQLPQNFVLDSIVDIFRKMKPFNDFINQAIIDVLS